METNSGELQPAAVLQEVPTEEAAMEAILAMKDRHGDRHLAVGRR
jgi:hypothetical protein